MATISSAGLATAIQNGTSTIIAVATESVSGWATLNVDVVELLITSGKFDAAVLGEFYSVTLTSEGASSPSWSVTAGALPHGLSLDGSTGVISMQRTEVTQAQWVEILGSNPSAWATSCGSTCALDRVSWDMIQGFLGSLNARYPGQNFRLPTEAEWEYAARAGSTGDFGGNGNLDDLGWYFGNGPSSPMPLALKAANAWGLFDMHGNVEEWVQDYCSAAYYAVSALDDPAGPATGTDRVLRGGSFGTLQDRTRSAARSFGRPNNRGFTVYLGFRLAKDPSS